MSPGSTAANGGHVPRSLERWFAPALVLMGLAIVINYVDRGNLSLAAPIVKTELNLSTTQLGLLFSAFFYTYTVLQFVIGGVVDRFGANRVLTTGFLLWSLATVATGFAGGFAVLLVCRLLLGVGESMAFPCTSKVIAQNVSPENRGLANGVITAGLKLGPAVGAYGAGPLIAKYGWRPVFWGVGALSLLWLPAWWIWMPPTPSAPPGSASRVGYVEILRQQSFWGCAAGHFSFNYLSYFFLTWLPFYLAHERGLSQQALSRAAGTYYLVDSVAALLTGMGCDHLIRRGARASLVRKTASAAGHTTAAVGIIGCALAGAGSYYPWLLLAGLGSGAAGCGVFLFAQTIAGPRVAGQWSALQNGFGNLAGVIGPTLTGWIVDRSGRFFLAFAVAAAISITGAILWIFAVRLAPAHWAEATEARPQRPVPNSV